MNRFQKTKEKKNFYAISCLTNLPNTAAKRLRMRQFEHFRSLFQSHFPVRSKSPAHARIHSVCSLWFRAELFKAGLRWPRVSSKFEFRYESLKSKFSWILFVNSLMIGYSKENRENCPRKCFWWKEKRPGLKFNPVLALIGLRTTGPSCSASCCSYFWLFCSYWNCFYG